jgi:hypothetical protein
MLRGEQSVMFTGSEVVRWSWSQTAMQHTTSIRWPITHEHNRHELFQAQFKAKIVERLSFFNIYIPSLDPQAP